MKGRWTFISMLGVGLLLALVIGMGQAQASAFTEEPGSGRLSVAGTVGQKISYQGTLTVDGVPVDGTRPMVFNLYSDDSCATLVDTIDAGSVQVNEGLFDVALTVDQDDFNGQGLWLEVEVNGAGLGCEELLPVPYALSLRPGAIISDTDTYVEVNRFVRGSGLALNKHYGLYANATGSGLTYGVYGESLGSLGAGVVGVSNSASGRGVYAYNSAGGYAGYFVGDVGQRGGDDGLVKAAAMVYCSNLNSVVNYHFNNVGSSVSVAEGTANGRCTIDFGFDLTERYWSATSAGTVTVPTGVSCSAPVGANDKMQCVRWRDDGTGADGLIMLVVY